jgi:hypothetical protein
MKFSATRKELKKIKGKKLRKDLEGVVGSIEKSKDLKQAGRIADLMFNFVAALNKTLEERSRLAMVGAIYADARKNEVPHQWERKEDCACGKKNDCSRTKPDSVCYHDTSGPACISG